MGFGFNFEKIRARLARVLWSKTSETASSKQTQTKKKAAKLKDHWLKSKPSGLDLRESNKRDSAHILQEVDPSWSSRRKSSLNRLSAANMTFVEEVRLPKNCKQYQYVPLCLDLSSQHEANYVGSEGIEMELDTDIERRGSMPKSPRKPIPAQRIGSPALLPSESPARLALDLPRTLSFETAFEENITESQIFEPRSSLSRRLRPAPLNLSKATSSAEVERRSSKDRAVSTYFTPGWIAPICASPESMSIISSLSRCGLSSSQSSRQSSLSQSSPVRLSNRRPIQILRPCAKQSVHCELSETPLDRYWDARMGPDSPRSFASHSTAGSRTTAARWFAVIQRTGRWDL